ncbi:MAG: sigma-70 family RNA polymerase sigma factor [Pirellulales bacterium]|nr:sigma-70 family RNA polymerase sigma factor [Pirellulales bacterium]
MPNRKKNVNHEHFKQLSALWMRAQPSVSLLIRAAITDFHQAEDVLQEVAVRVSEKIDTYDTSRPFVPWVLAVTRNCIAQHFRDSGKSKLVFSDELVRDLSNSIEPLEDDLRDQISALRKCLKLLKGRTLRIIESRYRDAKSAKQVANDLEISENAVWVSLSRARQTLSECIQRSMEKS